MTGHVTPASTTITDVVLPRMSSTLLVVGGATLVAALAQVEVPLWPVPVTGQTLGVLLVGAALGARRGATALLVYLCAGLAGLPVFAGFAGGPAAILSPSFGYILGFVPAAACAGAFAQHRWDRHIGRSLVAAAGGTLIPFVIGVPYLALMLPRYGMPADVASVIAYGVTPFIVGAMVKVAVAAVTLPLLWKLVRRVDN